MKIRERDEAAPATGQPAPDFVLDDVDGHPRALHELRGKRVLLVFWAPWSPLALAQARSLQRLSDGPYAIVDVALDALDGAQIKQTLGESAHSRGLHLLGHSTPLARWGGFPILPAIFVIDSAGVIEATAAGYVDVSRLQGLMGRSSGRSTRSRGIALRTFSPTATTPAISSR